MITWDFDVLYHDILFTVFRLAKPLKHISANSNFNNLATTKNVTLGQESVPNKPGKIYACKNLFRLFCLYYLIDFLGASSQVESNDSAHHKSWLEKHWKENVDFYRVEHPIVCHDGESIQVVKPLHFTPNTDF